MPSRSGQLTFSSEPTPWYRIGWPLFFAGVPFQGWSTPGLLLLVVDWVLARRRLRAELPTTYRIAVLSLVAVFVLTSAAASRPFEAFGTALGFTLTLLFGADYSFRLARMGLTGVVLSRYLWPVPIAGTLHALLGIYQYITTNARAAGTTINPNHFGTLMIIAGFLGAAYLLPKRNWMRWLSIPYGLIILAGLLVSGSRGSWVAAVVGLVVVTGLHLRKICREHPGRGLRTTLIWLIAAVVIGAAIFQLAGATFQVRVLSIFDVESNMDRVIVYRTMGRLIADHPWLGVGLNNIKYEYGQYRIDEKLKIHGMAHNMFLQVLGETGIFGLIATCFLLGFWLVRGFPLPGAPRDLWWLYALLVALLVRDQFDGTLLNLNLAFLLNWLGATLVGCRLREASELPRGGTEGV